MDIKLLLIIVSIEGILCHDYRLFERSSRLSSWLSSRNNTELRSKFVEHAIVTDVIDASPKFKAQVGYPSGVEVKFGNELTPLSVKDQPIVNWPMEEGQLYTLIMTDPDVPNRKEPTSGQVKHWLVMNIPGTDISKGETLAAYRGSAPPEGSGLHRYIFLVYKQSGPIKHSETHTQIPIEPENRKDRTRFNVREFIRKYNLGDPIAGNFYQAQCDDYTKQLWAKWNSKGNERVNMEMAIESKFKASLIVPDIVDFAPKEKLIVQYPSGVELNLGKELTPLSVKDEPSIKWLTDKDQFYTLAMLDADVPSRTNSTLSSFKHWLIMNIPETDLAKGESVANYIGSAPPEGTGLHRYVFLVYKQLGLIKHSEDPVSTDESRMKFNIRQFARKYDLGQPLAGNFFESQSDEYSRQLWAEWTKSD